MRGGSLLGSGTTGSLLFAGDKYLGTETTKQLDSNHEQHEKLMESLGRILEKYPYLISTPVKLSEVVAGLTQRGHPTSEGYFATTPRVAHHASGDLVMMEMLVHEERNKGAKNARMAKQAHDTAAKETGHIEHHERESEKFDNYLSRAWEEDFARRNAAAIGSPETLMAERAAYRVWKEEENAGIAPDENGLLTPEQQIERRAYYNNKAAAQTAEDAKQDQNTKILTNFYPSLSSAAIGDALARTRGNLDLAKVLLMNEDREEKEARAGTEEEFAKWQWMKQQRTFLGQKANFEQMLEWQKGLHTWYGAAWVAQREKQQQDIKTWFFLRKHRSPAQQDEWDKLMADWSAKVYSQWEQLLKEQEDTWNNWLEFQQSLPEPEQTSRWASVSPNWMPLQFQHHQNHQRDLEEQFTEHKLQQQTQQQPQFQQPQQHQFQQPQQQGDAMDVG